jgi:mono/diheme cytochrome c family protein
VEELPAGNASAGSDLFHGRLACTSCHGNPATPEGPRIGPALGDFARVGAARISGMSAAQYAYESLLDPGAFIAPECAGQAPCARPSTMPLYGETLSPQEMADLISYLVNLRTRE